MTVWVVGTATAETRVLAPPLRAAVTCGLVEDDDALDIAVVMRAIALCQGELGLSDAQRVRVETLSRRFIEESMGHEGRRNIAEGALAALLRPDPSDPGRPVDTAAAEAKIREIGRIVSDQEISALHTVEATKAVLTSPQRAKLAALLAASRGPRHARIDL